MGNKTFGRWNGHKLLEMADAESWEMVVIITTVYFCWAVCWKICGERRTLEMRVKNLIDARLLIKVIIFGWYLFARGPQRLFPKKKQIVCAAHLFRPLQPFQSSYVDLSGPCGGDGGVGGQKSLDHPLSAYTHTLVLFAGSWWWWWKLFALQSRLCVDCCTWAANSLGGLSRQNKKVFWPDGRYGNS